MKMDKMACRVRTWILVLPLALLGTGISACGAQAELQEDESVSFEVGEDAVLAEVPNADGVHFTATDTLREYRLYGGNKYCWVYDLGQSDALVGYSPTNTAYQSHVWNYYKYQMASYGRSYQGHCKYPTGCFRKRDENPIYRVDQSKQSFCWLKTPAKVAQVCGSSSAYLNILRATADIKFEQDNWMDASDVLHTAARYKFDGYCP